MLDAKILINSYIQIGYSVYKPELWDVYCLFQPYDNNSITVICDNSHKFLISKSNIAEVRKVLLADPHLPSNPHFLFVVLNEWTERKLVGRDIILINQYSLQMKKGHLSKEVIQMAKTNFLIVEDNRKKCIRHAYQYHTFNEKRRVIMCYVIALCTVAAYFFTSKNAVDYGIVYDRIHVKGEYYRFITYMLTHGNILHLIGNMITLMYCGSLLEERVGALKFIFLYVLSGVYGAAVSLYLGSATTYYTVGASGAIYGVLGALIAKELFISKYNRTLKLSQLIKSILFMFLSGCFSASTDNICHIGGLIAGFLLGTLFTVYDCLEYKVNHLKLQNYELSKNKIG